MKKCSIKDCNREYHSKGYCDFHNLQRQWSNIRNRCYNPQNSEYKNYGARGIKLFSEWIDDFESFQEWILSNIGPRPEQQTLDRINVNGNYEPGNLKWSTVEEQARNKRSNILISYNGKTQILADWSKELNIDYGMIRYRLSHGWSVEEAFTIPPKQTRTKNQFSREDSLKKAEIKREAWVMPQKSMAEMTANLRILLDRVSEVAEAISKKEGLEFLSKLMEEKLADQEIAISQVLSAVEAVLALEVTAD